MATNPLFKFLNQGLTENLPLMGEEKNMTYEGQTLKGYFNERSEEREINFGGMNNTRLCTFLIPQSEIAAAAVNIQQDKECTLDSLTWKINGINHGPSATTVFLSGPNESKI